MSEGKQNTPLLNQNQPIIDKPTNQMPIQDQPMSGQPMQGQPISGQLMQGQPMPGQPMPGQPMQGQPMPMYQPMPGQPMQGQPLIQGQPMYQPQMGGQPMYQPPMGGQPMYQPPMLGRIPINFVPNPLEELNYATSAIIKQQNEVLEMLTGCETANRYHVFIQTRDNQSKYLFKCKEQSSWCDRNCCPSNVRPFRMRLKHVQVQGDMSEDFKTYYSQFDRPFQCTCCCFCRPVMSGSYFETNVPFGKIREPCTVCSPKFDVYEKNGTVKYKIFIDCCQCGFACRSNFCGKLSNVTFDILDTSEQRVGVIKKKTQGLIELFGDADTFVIDFPADASPDEKMTLIGAVLMIDYRYYEEDDKGLLNANKH